MHGPGFIFLFHPSLGPLWDIIAQKMRGGALTPGSEMVLEVSEAESGLPACEFELAHKGRAMEGARQRLVMTWPYSMGRTWSVSCHHISLSFWSRQLENTVRSEEVHG